MASLTLVVPKPSTPSGPIRIIISLPSTLLHHFDASLANTELSMNTFMTLGPHTVSRELVQRAIVTCSCSDLGVPEIVESYMFSSRNDKWSLWIQADCSVPKDEKDPPVIAFQAKEELDDDGNVEFIPLVPRNAKARDRYNTIFRMPDIDAGAEYDTDSS